MWKVILIMSLIIIVLIFIVLLFKFFSWIIIPSYIAGVISALWIQSLFKKKTPKKEKV